MGTNSGPEILLPLGSPRPGRPRRAQLESALRDAVRTGRLAAGQRLPPATSAPAARRSPDHSPRWDMRPGIPTLSAFPSHLWRRAWTAALGAVAGSDLAYPDPAGHPRLRQVLAHLIA